MIERRTPRRWRMLIPATLLVVLVGMLSGCLYFKGSPLDGQKDFRKTANGTFGFGGFKTHKTTRSQVEAALGPPWHVSPDGSTVVYTMTLNGYAVVPLCFSAEQAPSAYAMAIRYAPNGSIERYKIEHDDADVVTIFYARWPDFWSPLAKLAGEGFDVPRPPQWPTTRPSTRPVSRPASEPASADRGR